MIMTFTGPGGAVRRPDITLSILGFALVVLGAIAGCGKHLQVLFVTLDPRDTPEVLRSYVPAFNPNFLGLYADADMTKQLTRDFKVFYEEIPGNTPTSYTIDHSVYTYAFDTRGRLRLLMAPTEPLEQKLEDLRALLAGA